MKTYVCAFTCCRPAVGVVPTTHPDPSIRRRPICDRHVQELIPEEPNGSRVIQMFGAIHPDYKENNR